MERRGVTLYYTPGGCSLFPHIVLRELGLEHRLERVDLATGRTESGRELTEVNPKGSVPVLELEDGRRLTETVAIAQYLASLKPGLTPDPASWDHFRMLEWLNFLSTEVQKSFGHGPGSGGPDLPRLTRRFAYIADQLGEGDSILGPFTLVDAYLYVMLTWCQLMDIPVSTRLKGYRERVAARPAVQQALRTEAAAR